MCLRMLAAHAANILRHTRRLPRRLLCVVQQWYSNERFGAHRSCTSRLQRGRLVSNCREIGHYTSCLPTGLIRRF